MIRAARTSLTLIFLCALVLGATLWGWSALTAPLPKAEEAPLCEDTHVPAGTKVYPDQVVVSVFNASTRSGLASRSRALFAEQGFVAGGDGNGPRGTKVGYAQIWSAEPDNPAVKLVKSFLGPKTPVLKGERLGEGIVVVVGPRFNKLVQGEKSAESERDAMICAPPGTMD